MLLHHRDSCDLNQGGTSCDCFRLPDFTTTAAVTTTPPDNDTERLLELADSEARRLLDENDGITCYLVEQLAAKVRELQSKLTATCAEAAHDVDFYRKQIRALSAHQPAKDKA